MVIIRLILCKSWLLKGIHHQALLKENAKELMKWPVEVQLVSEAQSQDVHTYRDMDGPGHTAAVRPTCHLGWPFSATPLQGGTWRYFSIERVRVTWYSPVSGSETRLVLDAGFAVKKTGWSMVATNLLRTRQSKSTKVNPVVRLR